MSNIIFFDNPEMKERFIGATDEHVDNIIDFFESNPILIRQVI